MATAAKFLVRKTSAQWAATNPVLGLGTFGIEVTTNQLKIGDGATDWAGLPYMASPVDLGIGPTASTEQHIASVWTANNPILGDQVLGYETDTRKVKVGNGTTPWRQLPYLNGKEPVGVLLLETGAALLLEDGTLLLLAGGVVSSGAPYEPVTRIEIIGGLGASMLTSRSTGIVVTGSLAAGVLLRSRIPTAGSLGATAAVATRIPVVGSLSSQLTGSGPYPMADTVADAIGVNVHLEYGGSIYDTGWASIVKPRLIELGTRHIRSGVGSGTAKTTATTRYRDLSSNHGIKLLLINTSYVADTSYMSANKDFVEAVENRNEPDVFDNSPADNWKPNLRARHITFWNAVRAISALDGIKVLPSPLGHANNLDWWHANFSDFGSYCDVGSLHDYANDTQKTIPEATTANAGGGWDGFGAYWTNTQVESKYRTDLGGVKDIYSTEIGPRYDGTAASNAHQAAKAVARHLLTRVLGHGRKRLYFYQLIENSGGEDFGLLDASGTPRQAFHALRNIQQLFRNAGPDFRTTTLGYSVSGATSDMRQYVVQRRDGTWLFVIWRGTGDGSGKFTATEGTRATVTLTLTSPIARARRYEPTLAASLAASLKQRYLSPASISISVPDHPVVVELNPPTANRSGLPWPSGMDPISDASLSEISSLGTFRGRPLDCSTVFMGGGFFGNGKTWSDMTGNNYVVRAGGQIQSLVDAGIRVCHAMPICLNAERGDNAKRIYQDMQTTGSVYVDRYRQMFDRIAAWATQAQQEMIAIRIGWEGNRGYPWSINDCSALDQPYWTAWWEEIAAIGRDRLPYADLDWNHLPNANGLAIGPYKPADELFDIVSCDVYDGRWVGYWVDSDANWNTFKGSYNAGTGIVDGPQGFVDYARAIGKRVAFPEWGATNRLYDKDTNPTPATDGSNNTVFVTKMYELFQTNADILAYENYFNGPGEHRIEPTICQPNPRAAYLAAWTP